MSQSIKILILTLIALGVQYIQGGKPIVKIYYETLCPDTRNFILGSYKNYILTKTKMAHVELIPNGNSNLTRFNGTTEFTCQHGEEECYGNRVHNCVFDYFKGDNAAINDYLFCHFTNAWVRFKKTSRNTTEYCFDQLNYSQDIKDDLHTCINGDQGLKLQAIANLETPTHTFIPWVTINGERTEENAAAVSDSLIHFLCTFDVNKDEEVCDNSDILF